MCRFHDFFMLAWDLHRCAQLVKGGKKSKSGVFFYCCCSSSSCFVDFWHFLKYLNNWTHQQNWNGRQKVKTIGGKSPIFCLEHCCTVENIQRRRNVCVTIVYLTLINRGENSQARPSVFFLFQVSLKRMLSKKVGITNTFLGIFV